MAKDYKHRISTKKKNPAAKRPIARWQWLLIAALVFGFIFFLIYLKVTAPKETHYVVPQADLVDTDKAGKNAPPATEPQKNPPVASEDKDKKAEQAKPKPPHFEFYTVLPDKEVVVPDFEQKTRIREERIGKGKEAKYVMQVGSFQAFKEADQLRAKLAMMGIVSKVEKTKVEGGSTLFRVKLGPFSQMKSVNDIRLRLKTMGANVIVTEVAAKKPEVQVPQQHR